MDSPGHCAHRGVLGQTMESKPWRVKLVLGPIFSGSKWGMKRRRQWSMDKKRESTKFLQTVLMLFTVCMFSIKFCNLCPSRLKSVIAEW